MASNVSQHKRMAMGEPIKRAKGGSVPMKTGMPENPITKERHMNGVPGMKRGGKVKGC